MDWGTVPVMVPRPGNAIYFKKDAGECVISKEYTLFWVSSGEIYSVRVLWLQVMLANMWST